MDGMPPCAPHRAAEGPMKLTLEPGLYSWCACGYSKTQPFCDGTHKEESCPTNRRSLKFEITEERTVSLCCCKHTKTPPFCDGTHKTLIYEE